MISQRNVPGGCAGADADRAVTALYEAHYRPLVRLAALLVQDLTTAQDIVQDSFVALYRRWRSQDTGVALEYLRHSVVRRSRWALRRPIAAGQPAAWAAAEPAPSGPDGPSPPRSALEQPKILAALGRLPARQREALVLGYYAGLPDTQIASITGITPAAVKSHAVHAMAALRPVLDSLQE